MPATDRRANPFPGLRPFEAGESHLFFGRDGQSRELVRRLGLTRFLAVVGTSGSGKSSLVRAGLLPALRGGMMDGVDGGWRVAAMRPGDNPIGNLAAALTSADALGPGDPGEAAMQAAFAEAALRRSSLGLIDVVRQERGGSSDGGPPLPEDENVLVLVDQFEEIFRFRSLIEVENSKEDAAAFVRLLLEAAGEVDERIYVVLTMRSDFLGDCSQFQGLPEAINDGQYLIPRMTRDERREAVTGPVAVGGGSITDPLVNQLLNDMGDNPDQLPILQHALMRTWDYWLGVRRDGEAIDLPHYRAVGGMSEALSLHAEEAYDELGTPGQKEGQQSPRQHIAEKLFKGLTEKGADNREIRRPVELREACEIAGADVAEVAAVVEVFRRAGRSFLMPPPDRPLTPDSLIDISHESLIRNWDRLKGWVDDEAQSARVYRRLAETAALYEKKEAGLWGDPDLQRALDWREGAKPNETWAKRYNPGYESAMSFLKLSSEKREADAAAEERRRREKERMLRGGIAGLSVLLILMLGATAYAWAQSKEARRQAEIARHQTAIAEDQTLKADSAKRDAEQLYEAALRSAESEKRQKDLAERKEAEARQQEAEAKTQKRLAEQQRAAAEKAKAAAERAKAAAEKAKAAAERAKAAAVSAQAETERRRVEAEMATVEAKRLAEVAELEREKATKANAEFQDVLSDLTKVERSAPFYHYMVRYKNVDVPVSATFTDEGDKVWTSFANNVFYLTEKTADPTLVSTPFGKTPDGVPGLKVAHLGAAGLGKFAFAFPNADKTAPVALGYAALDRNDKTVVKLWRPGDKEPTPLTHDAEVTSIAADPKGERLVTSSADGTVRLWEVGSGNSLGELRGHLTTVNSAVFSHDGSRVVTASDDETAQLWDARGGYGSVVLRGHTSGVHKAVFSPDDALVLTAGKDNTARLWDSRSGELVQVLEGHTDEVVDAAFAPDGKRLVTASLDRTAIVWQQFKGREGVAWKSVAVLRGHIDALTSVDVSADSNYVATAGVDSTTRVWNLTELNGFRVSGVELQSRKTAYSGLCPAPLKVTGKISAKGAAGGTVKYKFVRSDGAESPVRELVFDGPGKKDVSWTGDYYSKAPVSSVSVRVEVIEPKVAASGGAEQARNRAEFDIACAGTRALFTEELLAKIMPTLPADKRAQYVDPLHLAMLEFGIDTPPRQAAFLAAIAYESAELKFTVEPGDGKAYEGRRDLGNIHPGDGPRFKGRSPIQLTGRNNYKVYGQLLGIDLVAEPEKAAAPEVMFRLAGLFWQKGGGNELADTVEERPDFAFMLRKVFRISDHDASSDARYKLFERARRVLLNPQPSGDTQKLAAISQKPSGWGVEILKVNVNGTGTNSAVVAPGTVVPVIVAYSIADPKCPGCVDQIQVGLAAEATPAGCVYDGTPGTDPVTDKGAVYVTAPSEPGVYYIGFDRSQGYSCVADRWWSGWKDEPGAPARQRYIGIIEVK